MDYPTLKVHQSALQPPVWKDDWFPLTASFTGHRRHFFHNQIRCVFAGIMAKFIQHFNKHGFHVDICKICPGIAVIAYSFPPKGSISYPNIESCAS